MSTQAEIDAALVEYDRVMAGIEAADAARRAAIVPHIRRRLPRSSSTNTYLDRRDLSARMVTFCGAPITEMDVAWKSRGTKWTREHACPDCVEAAKDSV